jgi:hypothetical protein
MVIVRSDSFLVSAYTLNPQQSPSAPVESNPNQDLPRSSRPEYGRVDSGSHGESTPATLFHKLNLPPDVLAFIRIPINQFRDCSKFISKNRGFLASARVTWFENAADEAIRSGDIVLMQQCIQRRVIVTQCKESTRYLDKLMNNDHKVSKHFYETCTQLADAMNGKMKTRQDHSTTSVPQAQTYHSPGNPAIPSDTYASAPSHQPSIGPLYNTGYAEGSMLSSRYPVARGPYDPPGNDQSGMSTQYPISSGSGEPTSWSQISATEDNTRPPIHADLYANRVFETPNTSGHSNQRQRGNSQTAYRYQSANDRQQGYTPGSRRDEDRRSGVTREAVTKSTRISSSQFGDPEPLDPRYKTQNGRTFFIRGRVFAMMFPEPKGVNPHTLDTGPDDSRSVIQGPYGVDIFTHKKRFVVMRAREGHCLCVPINSYTNTGVGRKAIPVKEKRAHAIIYDKIKGATNPILPGEGHLVKEPIAVSMIRGFTLDATSRIHFGKTYTIEWNVKVMAIGQIHSESEEDVETYWCEEVMYQ